MHSMKKLLKSSILWLILVVIMLCVIRPESKIFSTEAATNSSEVLIEQSTRRQLFGRFEDVKLPMASTTKILTCLVIIESCDLSDIVVVPRCAEGVEGSSIYLSAGEEITVEALLYGLMLRSGNDAAVTLAIHCSGSIESFSTKLNQKAEAIGAVNSNFKNPHGLNDDEHYTTAKDLALITAAALDNDIFKKIVSTRCIRFGERTFVNKNKMLYNYDGADGVKTGYTVKAGRCLVTSATRNGMQLISVVLNCSDMYERSQSLLNKGFSDYQMVKICDKDDPICKVPVVNGFKAGEYFDVYIEKDLVLPLAPEESKFLTVELDCVEKLVFPINKGQFIGNLFVFSGKDLLFSSKLVTISNANDYSIVEIFKGIITRF